MALHPGLQAKKARLSVWQCSLNRLPLQAANGYQQQNRGLPAWPQRPQLPHLPLQSMVPRPAYPAQQTHQMHQPAPMVPQHNGQQPGQAWRPPYNPAGYQPNPMGYQTGAGQTWQSLPGAAGPVKTGRTNNADLFIVDDDEEEEEDLVQPRKRLKGETGQAVPKVSSQGGVWGTRGGERSGASPVWSTGSRLEAPMSPWLSGSVIP